MKMATALFGACTILILSGCSTDPREPAVRSTLDLLETTTAKVAALTTAIDTAITKATPETGIVLTDANEACKALKTLCQKDLQPKALEIQLLQRTTSEEEKKQLKEKFQSTIETSVTTLNAKTLALNSKIKELKQLSEEDAYSGSKDQVAAFITKTYKETVAEFDSLNRQLK